MIAHFLGRELLIADAQGFQDRHVFLEIVPYSLSAMGPVIQREAAQLVLCADRFGKEVIARGRRDDFMKLRIGSAGALTSYPHQFSGGMRQRIMLASVMLLKPALLIADEPTTALDAVVQRDVLELMVELTRERGTAALMISHDLGMIARYSDRAIVMSLGDVVEQGNTQELLARPQHPYTRKLLAAMPTRGPVRVFATDETPIVSVRKLVVDYGGRQGFFRKEKPKRALHGVSIDVLPKQVVALVGGSGSGKTTLGHAIAGLVKPLSGQILFEGRPIDKSETAYWDYRLNCQMVFQDPYSSLDPRMTIGDLVGEALRLMPDMSAAGKKARIKEALSEVGLGDASPSAIRTSFRAASASASPSPAPSCAIRSS